MKTEPVRKLQFKVAKFNLVMKWRLPLAAVATVFMSLIFALAPWIDLETSAYFFHPTFGFSASTDANLKLLRSFGLLSINLSVFAVAILTLLRCVPPIQWQPLTLSAISPSRLIFLSATWAIGPGLIANAVLKDHWGRARPVDISLFGGLKTFTIPWVVSDACTRNCSFVSGEGSGVFTLIAFAFVVPSRLRLPVAIVTFIWASVISINRIAFGGHFLSDILIGWGLMLTLMLCLSDLILRRWRAAIDGGVARWTGPQQSRAQ